MGRSEHPVYWWILNKYDLSKLVESLLKAKDTVEFKFVAVCSKNLLLRKVAGQ